MARIIDSDFLHRALQHFYGYSSFRTGQEEIISEILHGQPVLAVLPTGAGKSICFQLPSLLLKGVTLVISPLISLMKDQAEALTARGIPAAYLDSSMSSNEYGRVLHAALNKQCKFLYVAPERLVNQQFIDFARKAYITMVAVDEAHCVSQWGHSFRKEYYNIPDFIQALPTKPLVAAFTATATPDVRRDIIKRLGIPEAKIVVTGFDRPNLHFAVQRTQDKERSLLEFMRKHKKDCGVVYCATRNKVESVTQLLQRQGFSALRYHAGLTPEERRENQNAFVGGSVPLIVATNAFGMGIDKPDVRFVVHYNMPKDIESYYQEAGRAGRDGEPSECILYYEPRDVRTNRLFIENGEENSELDEETRKIVKERDLDRLKQMTFYCFTSECLRQYILNYFGEKSSSYCGNCLNCQTQFEEVDITLEANTILRCLDALDWNYGAATVIDIVHGGKSQKILGKNLDKNPEYAVLSERTVPRLRQILRELQFREYVEEKGEQYPVICLTPEGKAFMKTEEPLIMKLPKEETQKKSESKEKKSRHKKGVVAAELSEKDAELFESLRELRREIASEEKVPPYMVFADKTLAGMCVMRPATRDEMLEVSGVGEHKLEKYGDRFLEILRKG